MKDVHNIIFDFGGVILDIDPLRSKEAFRRLFQGNDTWDDAWRKAVPLMERFEAGALREQEFFNEIGLLFGNRVSQEKLMEAWNLILGDLPAARISLLRSVRKHYHTFLLSNSNVTHYKVYTDTICKRYEPEGFNGLFDGAVFSFMEGGLKPEPEIYQILLERYSLKPSQTLFIDDREDNTEAARALGMNAIWLQQGQEVADLFTTKGQINAQRRALNAQ